ncbi:hypothetical protein HYN48_14270 [Flavobacterium magnum]|uniref:Uncharacterized protein n=2 Tax=Flavobacterium magnum TaxID=2162713 RepID=A0A2S0RHL1_9FLAO|nr:hypothetical protein HYN48_14270 [Flavobacterium magnum]
MKDIYIQEFKTVYFKSLLRKGFNNSKGYNDAVKIDNSHFVEPILSSEDYKYIDSLTTIGNKFMATDSLESFGRRAEGAAGKRVFYYALEKYNSKWLDSICKKRLERYWKAERSLR